MTKAVHFELNLKDSLFELIMLQKAVCFIVLLSVRRLVLAAPSLLPQPSLSTTNFAHARPNTVASNNNRTVPTTMG